MPPRRSGKSGSRSSGLPVEFTVEQQALQRVTRALREEADGKLLRRELLASLRKAVAPAVREAKASIQSMPSHSTGTRPDGGSLRAAVARQVRVAIRTTGRSTGVKVRVPKKNMPRAFVNAPKRLNRRRGWRHPLFGDTDHWINQVGKPGWFDDPMRRGKPEYQRAVTDAVRGMAERIARKA